MWKEYSISHMKKNKASCITIIIGVMIASMFLSLITTLFYNMWMDNINQVIQKEGDWQAKIIGNLTDVQFEAIRNYNHVSYVTKQGATDDNVEDSQNLSEKNNQEVSIYFHDQRNVYTDMPKIAQLIDIDTSQIQYHDKLLGQYFIYDTQHGQISLLLLLYLVVLFLVCFSLVLIIRNGFLISMEARIHQLGILSSIGATPGQIFLFLMEEALALSLLPIIVGISMGIGLCELVIQYANLLAATYRGSGAQLAYHPVLYLISFLISILTVLSSTWVSARRISKVGPLNAIRGVDTTMKKKPRRTWLLSHIFGIEGELSGASLYVRRKSLRTATLSLTLSITAFSIFLCFITLSTISTKQTYFERYKDTWDVMATISDASKQDFLNDSMGGFGVWENTDHLNSSGAMKDYTCYQKYEFNTDITEEQFSNELKQVGGLKKIAPSEVTQSGENYRIKVPVIVLDDQSFEQYSKEAGIDVSGDTSGVILYNQIWDCIHSNFRNREYIPFLEKETQKKLFLYNEDKTETGFNTPILGYTNTLPSLREEYEDFALVQFMSEHTWKQYLLQIKELELWNQTIYINIKAESEASISKIQQDVEKMLLPHRFEIENRIQEAEQNNDILRGYIYFVGGICALLAVIGLANVCANAIGTIYVREREFARYRSIGVTPGGTIKILFIEAMVVGARPIIVTIPITALFIVVAAKASYISLKEFFCEVPVGLFLIFYGMILLCIAGAYAIGASRINKRSLIEQLKDETLV